MITPWITDVHLPGMGPRPCGGGQPADTAATHRPAAANGIPLERHVLENTKGRGRSGSGQLDPPAARPEQGGVGLCYCSLAHETEQMVEWTVCKNRANGTKWTRITEHIQMDVAQWIAERSKSALYEGAENKV